MMYLNAGCGYVAAGEPWVNVDIEPWCNTMKRGNICVPGGLPFDDASLNGAVAHHVLQDIGFPDLVHALSELRRVIRSDGWLRLSVPDIEGAFIAYEAGRTEWFPIANETAATLDSKLCLYLSQAGKTRSVFTSGWLLELLDLAGYRDAAVMAYDRTLGPSVITDLDTRPHESIYVDARV